MNVRLFLCVSNNVNGIYSIYFCTAHTLYMRGQRTLFSDFQNTAVEEVATKGRSKNLDARRNELLCARYSYYTLYFPLYGYEAIIELKLQNEFYLSPSRITDILQENVHQVSRVRKEKPAISWFRNKWPAWAWPTQS